MAQSNERKQSGTSSSGSTSDDSLADPCWFNADQLAEEVGCSVRRVRDLIQLGLVRRAVGQGRARQYTWSHVKQLRAVLHALDEANLTRGELLWVLDRDTPSRLRRQARDLEQLAGPRDRAARVLEVRVEGVLTVSIAGPIARHQRHLLRQALGTFAQDLRAKADFAESLRARLATPSLLVRDAGVA